MMQQNQLSTTQPLRGIKGCLLFFVVVFGLLAAFGLLAFFVGMIRGGHDVLRVVGLIYAPCIAVASVAAFVNIIRGKRLGKWLAIAAMSLVTLWMVTFGIVNYMYPPGDVSVYSKKSEFHGGSVTTISRSQGQSSLLSFIPGAVGVMFLVGTSLYFTKSRRVKETLVD